MDTNPQVWEKAISDLGHQLVDALKPVAEKMGVAAEHLYGVMVRQSLVEGISNIAGWWLGGFACLYLGYRLRKAANEKFFSVDYSGNGNDTARFFSWLIQIAAVVMIAVSLGVNLPFILNPEYSAIKTLLDTVAHTCTK